MSDAISLAETLSLEPIEMNLFRGFSPAGRRPRIFGGQVIAQALVAAYETVPERICHSLHCYFIRPGDPTVPILYEVDRARDGGSFTTRRVTAIQHGKQIFNLAASFQTPEEGVDHRSPPAPAPRPDEVEPMLITMTDDGDSVRWPVEVRTIDPRPRTEKGPAVHRIWMRAIAELGDQIRVHQAAMAYASDFSLLGVSTRPHGIDWNDPDFQFASLDHAIWFHRPVNFNNWHLYDQDSPSASGARGFSRGQLYSEDGVLVASVAQEGLIRLRNK